MTWRLNERSGEQGAILPMVAAALLFLFGMAAFAIDLGWLYLNGVRIQNAADNSSLAGVALLPLLEDDPLVGSQPYNRALEIAGANDYVNGVNATVTPALTDRETELRVSVSATVGTFFMRLFGTDDVTMTRHATAEFVPPLQLGSDQATMGTDPFGVNVGYWVAVNGEYTAKAQGDPYSTRCVVTQGTPITPPNMNTNPLGDGSDCDSVNQGVDYDPRPYYYAVDIPSGAAGSVTLQIYDPAYSDQSTDPSPLSTRENGWRDGEVEAGMATTFTMFGPDDTPNDPTDNNDLRCSRTFAPDTGNEDDLIPNPFGGPPLTQPEYVAQFKQQWVSTCTTGAGAGIYVLRVTVDQGSASNAFSFKASVGGGVSPAVYGLGRMSLFASDANANSRFQVAKVTPAYAGKDMIITLYDPGEVHSGTAVLRFDGEAAGQACQRRVRNWAGSLVRDWQTLSPCDITTSVGGNALYNAQFLDIRFSIPSDYTCSSDCWYRVNYDLSAGGNATDRTTWSAVILGQPIHLVE